MVVEEADESLYWLEHIRDCDFLRSEQLTTLLAEADELLRILGKSYATARSREGIEQSERRADTPPAVGPDFQHPAANPPIPQSSQSPIANLQCNPQSPNAITQSEIPQSPIKRARPEGRALSIVPCDCAYLNPNLKPIRKMRGFMISRIWLKFPDVTLYCLPSVVAVLNRLKMSKSMFAV